MTESPRQVEGVEINQVADGYVVYHPARDRVHYLNQTATIVLELCNGKNDAAKIASLLQMAYELPELPLEEVTGCLVQLRAEGLIA
jgi:hypothetical protein